MEASSQRLYAVVHGRVQGVGFRYYVADNAQKLGLTGWVRNRFNETVELVAEGPRTQLDEMLIVLRRGSRSSFVSSVDCDWQPATGEFSYFNIRPTG